MGVIARYREHLPVGPSTPEVDLQEGSTPLVPSLNIGRALGLERLYFKYEGLNPTGSFKDRGMVVAIAKALEAGSRVVMCASTGNTSASMAAYAARTGLRAIVDVLGDAPDYLVLPVGNAGNITAYWKGFREYHAAGRSTRLPRMIGAQAEGAAPIVT